MKEGNGFDVVFVFVFVFVFVIVFVAMVGFGLFWHGLVLTFKGNLYG